MPSIHGMNDVDGVLCQEDGNTQQCFILEHIPQFLIKLVALSNDTQMVRCRL